MEEGQRAYYRAYYATHKMKSLEAIRRYRATPKGRAKTNASATRYRQRHPERRAEQMRRARASQRAKVLSLLGGRCACCGEDQALFLEVHHCNGGGRGHFGRRGVWGVCKDILEDAAPTNHYQLLCANCHRAEERGGCPHQARADKTA